MLMEALFTEVDNLQRRIRETQTERIVQAAAMMTESVKNGGAIHFCDSGHLIDSELLQRAGGPMMFNRFKFDLTVQTTARTRDESGMDRSMEGLASYALKASKVLPGDVLIIGSVSGKTVRVVDTAIEARKLGIKVIAVTAVAYSSQLPSEHDSGKHLYECADLVLDNCAPFGDAMLDAKGIDSKVIPASGLAAAYLMWAVTASFIEQMTDAGLTPSMYRSCNFPENTKLNDQMMERYKKLGY